MIINIKQGTKDSKQDFLDTIEKLEQSGYILFEAKSYDTTNKLAEATLIFDVKLLNVQ